MIEIDVRGSIEAATRELTEIERKQIPFATARALTEAAEAGRIAVKKAIRRVFDRPTRFTENATFKRPATKGRLKAEVFLKDEAGKGVGAAKYLQAQIGGGARRNKRFEEALRARGMLPAGWQAVPGKWAKIDAFGNVPKGEIVKILADLRAFAEQGYKSNRLTKGAAREYGKRYRASRYFVVMPGKRMQPGIYTKIASGFGDAVRPVFIYVRTADYGPRLRFAEIVDRAALAAFPKEFDQALRGALATAR